MSGQILVATALISIDFLMRINHHPAPFCFSTLILQETGIKSLQLLELSGQLCLTCR
jgi:hypothetical protein